MAPQIAPLRLSAQRGAAKVPEFLYRCGRLFMVSLSFDFTLFSICTFRPPAVSVLLILLASHISGPLHLDATPHSRFFLADLFLPLLAHLPWKFRTFAFVIVIAWSKDAYLSYA